MFSSGKDRTQQQQAVRLQQAWFASGTPASFATCLVS
jgi:hypothetical protein